MYIKQIPSPNFGYERGTHGRNGQTITAIVLHIAEGSMAGMNAWFTNPDSEASSHFAIGKDGTIVQYVAEEDAAWTNGQINKPTWPLLIPGVNPNLQTLSVEHEGYTSEPWTDAMYAADIELISYLCKKWAIPIDRLHIIPHATIDSVNRARCPGTGLNWDRLMDGLKQHAAPVENITSVVRSHLNTYAWGAKCALKRGYIPFSEEVDIDGWYAQLCRKQDGSLVVLAYKDGEYTEEQTIEVPFNL